MLIKKIQWGHLKECLYPVFKVINRWFPTPNRLAKMFPNIVEKYRKCHSPQADSFHIWWIYEKFKKKWKGVNKCLQEIPKISVPLNPRAIN